jgi:hypothetical protein
MQQQLVEVCSEQHASASIEGREGVYISFTLLLMAFQLQELRDCWTGRAAAVSSHCRTSALLPAVVQGPGTARAL